MSQLIPAPAHESFDATNPVPAARPLDEFSYERLPESIILYDSVLNRYHTLNETAFDIWRFSDGVRTPAAIATKIGANLEVVETAIEQLGEAGLLQAPETAFESTMHRRKLVKLAAAGALGALALPVIQSITVPDSAAAQTQGNDCASSADCPPGLDNTMPTLKKCCCLNPQTQNSNCSDVKGYDPTCNIGTCANPIYRPTTCAGGAGCNDCGSCLGPYTCIPCPPPGFVSSEDIVEPVEPLIEPQTEQAEPTATGVPAEQPVTDTEQTDTSTEQVDTTTQQVDIVTESVDTTTEQVDTAPEQVAPEGAIDSADLSGEEEVPQG